MAEGGSDCPQGHDEPDASHLRIEQTRIEQRVEMENQTIGEQATVLLQHFIVERFQQDGFDNAPGLADLRGDVAIPSDQEEMWGEMGCMLRSIGDTLDRDTQLQRMIEAVPSDSPIEAIVAVAHVIFGDGDISWGRIVGLFYFAYRMCVKAIDSILEKSFPSWINKLIKEVVKFLVIKFAHWIINRGGWLAIREYLGSPTWIWSTLMASSVFVMLISIYKLSR